jgi:hypothetical protein
MENPSIHQLSYVIRSLISSYFCLCSAGSSSYVIRSCLIIPTAEVDIVDEDGLTGRAKMCCQSKPTGEQRQATQELGGSRDCWWAPVPRSTTQDPVQDPAFWLLGMVGGIPTGLPLTWFIRAPNYSYSWESQPKDSIRNS